MKMSKKMISAMLAAAMCVSLMAPAMAAQNNTAILSEGASTNNMLNNKSDPELIAEVFGLAQTRAENTNAITASYEYRMYENEEETVAPYYAEADIAFSVGSDTYTCAVEGEVDALELDSELTYLTGPLYGEMTINGVLYLVSAGFNKVMGQEGVSFCMVLIPQNGENGDLISFHFGEDVMTESIQADLAAEEITYPDSNPVPVPAAATSKGSVTGTISKNGKTGIKAQVFVDSSGKQISVEVTTYTDNAKAALPYAYSATVRKIEYYLSRNSGISEIEGLDADTDDNIMPSDNPGADEIIELIQFGLDFSKNPYVSFFNDKIIPAIQNATVQMYSKQQTRTSAQFYLMFGLGEKAVNFDKAPCAMVYSMVGNGTSSFTARALVEYAVRDDGGISYIPTSQVAKQFSTSF